MWSAREKWYNIGVRFKIGVQDLGIIGKESDVDTKFNQVIIKWLNRGVNCTWRTICDVLKNRTVDMEGLAINIGMIIINYIKYNYILMKIFVYRCMFVIFYFLWQLNSIKRVPVSQQFFQCSSSRVPLQLLVLV